MTTKPKFHELTYELQEQIVWDCDLDYDSYESSMAECVHMFMCGNGNRQNTEMVERRYESMELSDIEQRMKAELSSLEEKCKSLTDLLSK